MHIELTENEKNGLAKDCGYSEERYTDKVQEGVRKELGMSTPDETAILRKAFAKLLSEFIELKMFVKSEGISDEAITDFIIYNANVEQIKVKAKEDIQ
jgi:hypothetical protein